MLGLLLWRRQLLNATNQRLQELLGGTQRRDSRDPRSGDGAHLDFLVREQLQVKRNNRILRVFLEDFTNLLDMVRGHVPDTPRLVLRTSSDHTKKLLSPLRATPEFAERYAIVDGQNSHGVLLVLRQRLEHVDEFIEHGLLLKHLGNASQDVRRLAPHHRGVVPTKPHVRFQQIVLLVPRKVGERRGKEAAHRDARCKPFMRSEAAHERNDVAPCLLC
mmetsp:Transcript_38602/g.106297  ORF Transcript_38602/g.106297 Transcript_38602/m.106297 type:complete len:218 (+) Transcript_38602:861-1514(+)